jgi:aryl-alcohol dehydrogenase-like predicted oxidoreductase
LRPHLRPAASLLTPFKRRLVRAKNSRRLSDFSDRHLTRALDASLRRLGTDYIDLYQLHHPDTETLRNFAYQDTLGRFKREGKIRFIGASCDSVEDAVVALANPELDALQLRINLLDQKAIAVLLPQTQSRQVAVIARQPLAMGLLTDASTETKAERLESGKPLYQQRLKRAQALRFLTSDSRTMAQSALRYLLQLSGITLVLTGMSSRHHLDENLGAVDAPDLSEQEMARVQSIVCGE